MSNAEEATSRRPPRRRTPWSLRSIVVDVTGKPMSEFQEPLDGAASSRPPPGAVSTAEPEELDPVEHIYPPLVGVRGRDVHGPKREHHVETLDRHRGLVVGTEAPRVATPAHPERIYLHYLLLHLDRLSLASLWYLRRQVNDEIAARARPPPPRSE